MSKAQYKHYMLGLLTVVATFNFLDRNVLFLLMQPIKQDLQLSDSQLGFLTGFAFASFYAIAGIPLARWADRGNRNTVVFVTTTLWSIAVALCGLVGNFTQLLLMRIGVAVGEAGCIPPAQSLIADYFDRAERPRAMSMYWMCGPLSIILGYLGGGWLAEHFGWRITFIVMGMPGIFIALLVKFTLREPRLTQSNRAFVEQPSFKEVFSTLWQQHSFRHLLMAFCMGYFFLIGVAVWVPSFFMRSHGLDIAEIGMWMALIHGAGGVVGTYLGGFLVSRYATDNEALQMRAVALVYIVCGPLYVMMFSSSSHYLAVGFMAATGILFAMCHVVVFSVVQALIHDRMRSVAIALLLLLSHLIGLGLGPVATGILSDLLTPGYGEESLRYALLILSLGVFWVAFHLWKTGNTVAADIAFVGQQENTTTEFSAYEKENRQEKLSDCSDGLSVDIK